ncbi:HNH endonuclease [Streptomyces lavenduligriseus]|nr:HNH endonuclease [Streptomyces lavenduligriseus]
MPCPGWELSVASGVGTPPWIVSIDHLIPLAEGWDSGASAWSPAEWKAYANDLGDGRALSVVSAASNRSEADQDPTRWLPPAESYRCQYATDRVAEKSRWSLSVDSGEEAALAETLDRCGPADLPAPLPLGIRRC